MLDSTLKNKIVVITGGAQGIGLAIAKKLLEKCVKLVVILDIDEDIGNKTVKKLNEELGEEKTVFLKCDVTVGLETVVNNIINDYRKVDILVNNAGVSERYWKKCLDVNVKALIECSLIFFEHMRKDKGGNGGTIINISSLVGVKVQPFAPIYTASKFAVVGFSKSLGHSDNYQMSGVKVVALCPGLTETEFGKGEENEPESILTIDGEVREKFEEFEKTEKSQSVEAVGDAAVKVVANGSSGTAWIVDGGEPIYEV